MNEPTRDVDRSCDSQMADLLDEFTDRLNRGEEPDIGDYVRRCPEQATVLRQALEALLLMRQPAADIVRASELPVSPHAPGHLSNLGDFRILREIGRGGMGVVYEAEQVSLGRRLALKVLPFAATLDPRQLQRFRNEAQAAAALKHPNIVGIHSVGCERGVHYYAMELVEGRTLDRADRGTPSPLQSSSLGRRIASCQPCDAGAGGRATGPGPPEIGERRSDPGARALSHSAAASVPYPVARLRHSTRGTGCGFDPGSPPDD